MEQQLYRKQDLKNAFHAYYMIGFPHQINFDEWFKKYEPVESNVPQHTSMNIAKKEELLKGLEIKGFERKLYSHEDVMNVMEEYNNQTNVPTPPLILGEDYIHKSLYNELLDKFIALSNVPDGKECWEAWKKITPNWMYETRYSTNYIKFKETFKSNVPVEQLTEGNKKYMETYIKDLEEDKDEIWDEIKLMFLYRQDDEITEDELIEMKKQFHITRKIST